LVPEAMPFNQIIRLVADSRELLYPVVDSQGRLTGIFSLRDVRMALAGSDLGPLVVAADLAARPVITVTPQDDLHTALKRLTQLNVDQIPVVSPDDPTHLIGLLSRRELVSAYTSQIEALRSPKPMSAS
ncbi:MAG: CBS domain-containing protein, partial [Planctomycetaceae bacterium]|nr:CBS domain-containing protein [Planctomycetaceae bacterium]